MPWNQPTQTNNEMYNTSYTPGGHDKAKLRKILVIIVCVLICAGVVALIVHSSQPDKYTQSATAAARKQIPDAQVSSVVVAGNFAKALVRSPSSTGQLNAGNTTIFKVNKDGSMVQLASGSFFSPLDLLGLGVPLATQAKLDGKNISQVKQDLATTCGYNGEYNGPGYSGFDGSFNPGNWQIDPLTLDSLKQKLMDIIRTRNATATPSGTIICVNALREGSGINNGIFTIGVQFITSDGIITKHTLTYATEPGFVRSYTLDGQKI